MFRELEGWRRVVARLTQEQTRTAERLLSGNLETLADYKLEAGRYQGIKQAIEAGESIDAPEPKPEQEDDDIQL